MFEISNELLRKISARVTEEVLDTDSRVAGYSCGTNCNGNCDDALKKKPH